MLFSKSSGLPVPDSQFPVPTCTQEQLPQGRRDAGQARSDAAPRLSPPNLPRKASGGLGARSVNGSSHSGPLGGRTPPSPDARWCSPQPTRCANSAHLAPTAPPAPTTPSQLGSRGREHIPRDRCSPIRAVPASLRTEPPLPSPHPPRPSLTWPRQSPQRAPCWHSRALQRPRLGSSGCAASWTADHSSFPGVACSYLS